MNFEELKFLAKYPFLKEAKGYVNSLNLNLESLQKHPIYSAALDLGRERAIDAINGHLEIDIKDKISAEFSILSYIIARILVNLTHNKFLIERYSEGEAKKIFDFLKNENGEVIERIKNDVGGLKIDEEGKIPFHQYLKFSKNLLKKNKRWKLVNRELSHGEVKINEKEKLILLREAIKEKISELPSSTLRKIPKDFFRISKNLNSLFAEKTAKDLEIKEIKEEALPPCILLLLKSLGSGEISHQGMFILGTFFINLGLKKEKIVQIFSRFPRFSEEKTKYQIEFLSGEKSNVKYTCPSCEKIKFYGFCKEVNCGVKHPISYYMSRTRRK